MMIRLVYRAMTANIISVQKMRNDDLSSQITTSLSSSDDTGPLVSEKLSKLANDKFQTEYTVEKRKEILQKYKVPSNCNELFVSKVNSEIWTKLNANSKRSDNRTSVLQDTLGKVSSAFTVTVNDLLSHREKTSPDYKTLIPRLTDSVALIGHVHKELSFNEDMQYDLTSTKSLNRFVQELSSR